MTEPSPTGLLADAVRLHQSGNPAGAEALYRRILVDEPLHADALHLLGIARAQQGGPTREAVAAIAQACALNPASAAYRSNLAKATRGEWPAVGEALRDAGDALYDHGQPAAAARAYRAAVLVRPDDALTWGNQAAALRDANGAAAAGGPAGRAAILAPSDSAIATLHAGLLLHARDPAAADAIRRAITLNPAQASLHLGLADAIKIAGRHTEAAAGYRRTLTLDPASPAGWFNLGVTLGDLGRHDDSVAPYGRAVRLDPTPVDRRYNLAHAQLITGRWTEGWHSFAVRFERGVTLPDRALPRWRGEPLGGRTVLFYGEQGHGDAIQMMRYAPLIAEAGGRVVVECLPALVRLFAAVPGVAAALALGSDPPADLLCPMMDAPVVFATTPDHVPGSVPYLRVPVEAQPPTVPHGTPHGDSLTVGLVWAGDPHRTDQRWSHADTRRSIPLRDFATLLDRPGLRLVSLQKGVAAAQAGEEPFAGRILTTDIDRAVDFADTAALVSGLDLVISVDTAVAHLAGALGVPVWVLSRFDGCWRWLLDREDSPWYPSARIFRQTALGDWAPVLRRVTEELAAAQGDRSRLRPAAPDGDRYRDAM